MKSTTFTLLAAALASVCSAAPTAAIQSALPAKFSLSFVTLTGTGLPATGVIVSEQNYGFTLTLKEKVTDNQLTLVNFTGKDTTAFVHHPEFTRNFDWFISMSKQSPNGRVGLTLPVDIETGNYKTTGLAVVNGELTWDLGTGKGPEALWSACINNNDYTLFWDQTGNRCNKVSLKVHAL